MQPTSETNTADAGTDYIQSDIETTLTIPAGRTAASLTIEIVDDMLVEADEETFQLILVRSSSSDCNDMNTAVIIIQDDDCTHLNNYLIISKREVVRNGLQ